MERFDNFFILLIFSYARYFFAAGLAYLVLYKIIYPYIIHLKIQAQHATHKDFLREIFNSMVTASIFAVIGFAFIYTDLRQYTQLYTDVYQFPLWWLPVSFVLCLIIHDTYFYWMHRTLHHVKIYRTVHLTHHQSVNPSPWASYSFHFTEGVLEAMILPILIFLMPLHPSIAVLFSFAVLFINVYGHCGYEIMPKGFRKSFLFNVIATSTYHNLHHQKFNYNFGLYFRVWDRLMGTEYPDYIKVYDSIKSNPKSEAEPLTSPAEQTA
jgi:Delta7-sterol 5-desaturase